MSEILDQTLECAKEILGARALDLKIQRAVVGLFFSGVKLSGGACGLSYTPLKSLSGAVCCPSQASAMPDSGNIAGKSVRYLLRDLNSAAPLARVCHFVRAADQFKIPSRNDTRSLHKILSRACRLR